MAGELSAQSYEQMENPLQYFQEVSEGTNPMTRATPAYAPYTSTAGYRDLGGSAPYMDPALLRRPARKQVHIHSQCRIRTTKSRNTQRANAQRNAVLANLHTTRKSNL